MDSILAKVREDDEVVAVLLFGSRARGDAGVGSDVDLCLVLRPGGYTSAYLFSKKLSYLVEGTADIHIFSQLPLYIRRRVLKEGRVLFCRDEDLLYDIAYRTAQEFEDFRHMYREYLEGPLRA